MNAWTSTPRPDYSPGSRGCSLTRCRCVVYTDRITKKSQPGLPGTTGMRACMEQEGDTCLNPSH